MMFSNIMAATQTKKNKDGHDLDSKSVVVTLLVHIGLGGAVQLN